MIRFEKSETLQRKIRQDDWAELGIPTWTLVRQAIQAGRSDEALDFLEYGLAENQEMSYQMCSFVDDALTYLSSLGEEEVLKALRYRYEPRVRDWLSQAPTLTEQMYLFAETARGHFSNFTIVEEADRYVVTYDPCGNGSTLWRTKKNVGRTKQAYPWSWGKSGIPYYCAHCCVQEIVAVEVCGYPMYVTLPPEKPEDPCVALFYKKPELIPEEYFTRIGKTKTIK